MKPLDYFLLTISISWAILSLLKIWAMMSSFEVKYQKAKITIGWGFFIPYAIIAIVLYRVYG